MQQPPEILYLQSKIQDGLDRLAFWSSSVTPETAEKLIFFSESLTRLSNGITANKNLHQDDEEFKAYEEAIDNILGSATLLVEVRQKKLSWTAALSYIEKIDFSLLAGPQLKLDFFSDIKKIKILINKMYTQLIQEPVLSAEEISDWNVQIAEINKKIQQLQNVVLTLFSDAEILKFLDNQLTTLLNTMALSIKETNSILALQQQLHSLATWNDLPQFFSSVASTLDLLKRLLGEPAFNNIYFEFKKALILKAINHSLNKLNTCLFDNPQTKIQLQSTITNLIRLKRNTEQLKTGLSELQAIEIIYKDLHSHQFFDALLSDEYIQKQGRINTIHQEVQTILGVIDKYKPRLTPENTAVSAAYEKINAFFKLIDDAIKNQVVDVDTTKQWQQQWQTLQQENPIIAVLLKAEDLIEKVNRLKAEYKSLLPVDEEQKAKILEIINTLDILSKGTADTFFATEDPLSSHLTENLLTLIFFGLKLANETGNNQNISIYLKNINKILKKLPGGSKITPEAMKIADLLLIIANEFPTIDLSFLNDIARQNPADLWCGVLLLVEHIVEQAQSQPLFDNQKENKENWQQQFKALDKNFIREIKKLPVYSLEFNFLTKKHARLREMQNTLEDNTSNCTVDALTQMHQELSDIINPLSKARLEQRLQTYSECCARYIDVYGHILNDSSSRAILIKIKSAIDELLVQIKQWDKLSDEQRKDIRNNFQMQLNKIEDNTMLKKLFFLSLHAIPVSEGEPFNRNDFAPQRNAIVAQYQTAFVSSAAEAEKSPDSAIDRLSDAHISPKEYLSFIAEKYPHALAKQRQWCYQTVDSIHEYFQGDYLATPVGFAVWKAIVEYERCSNMQRLSNFWHHAKKYSEIKDYFGAPQSLEQLKMLLLDNQLPYAEKSAFLMQTVEKIIHGSPRHPFTKILKQYVQPEARLANIQQQMQADKVSCQELFKNLWQEVDKLNVGDVAAVHRLLCQVLTFFNKLYQDDPFIMGAESKENILTELALKNNVVLTKEKINKLHFITENYCGLKFTYDEDLLNSLPVLCRMGRRSLLLKSHSFNEDLQPNNFRVDSSGKYVDLMFKCPSSSAYDKRSTEKSIIAFETTLKEKSIVCVPLFNSQVTHAFSRKHEAYFVRIASADYKRLYPQLKYALPLKDLPRISDNEQYDKKHSGLTTWLRRKSLKFK